MKGRVKHVPPSTYASRLAALEKLESDQRDALRRPYAQDRAAGSYNAKKSDALAKNDYFRYFHSHEGDEETARRLLRVNTAQRSSPKRSASSSHAAHREDDIDITTLKPQSAKLFVKYQKLYDTMKAEDDEFIAFRKDYIQREKQRMLQQGGAVAAVPDVTVQVSAPR
jgi:hypothetical protein